MTVGFLDEVATSMGFDPDLGALGRDADPEVRKAEENRLKYLVHEAALKELREGGVLDGAIDLSDADLQFKPTGSFPPIVRLPLGPRELE